MRCDPLALVERPQLLPPAGQQEPNNVGLRQEFGSCNVQLGYPTTAKWPVLVVDRSRRIIAAGFADVNRTPERIDGRTPMAEGVRFELTVGFPTTVFKTGALNHSATPPEALLIFNEVPRAGLEPARLLGEGF